MYINSLELLKKNKYFIFGLIALLIPYIIWIIMGQNSYVLIHDNLDSDFVYIKLLMGSDLFGFDLHSKISTIMNGLDRYYFRSGLNVTFIFFYIFPPFYAYVVNHFIVHIVGYFGMFVLLKKYFIKTNDFLIAALSFCYGIISYYHIPFGISVSGIPLLLFVFLNILNKKSKITDWFIICFFPFFSFIIFTLPFYIPFLFFIGLYHYFQNKTIPKQYILAVGLLIIINILVEFNLIYSTFVLENTSHRTVWGWDKLSEYGNYPTFKDVLGLLTEYINFTHYHSGKFSTFPIIASILISIIILKNKLSKSIKIVIIILSLTIIFVATNIVFVYFAGKLFKIFYIFNTARFFLLLPFMWILLFALTLKDYDFSKKIQKFTAILLIASTCGGILIFNAEFGKNAKNLLFRKNNMPNFNQFYDVPLFNEMKEYIGTDSVTKYNVLSIGMHPAICQYNGFKTLDGYQNNYPLSYKLEFRKIIEGELDKDNSNKKYFDHWGNRCYAFTSTLKQNYFEDKHSKLTISNLTIDINQFSKMNGKYIISVIPIQNHKELGLKFRRSFTSENSFWKFYLYEK